MVFFPASMLETFKKKKKRAVMEADSMKEKFEGRIERGKKYINEESYKKWGTFDIFDNHHV